MTTRIIALALLALPMFAQRYRPPIPNRNVRLCDQFPGADASGKIAACIASLPAAGGTADARGFQGAQNISVDLFASAPARSVTLLLGDATFTCPAAPVVNSACISLPSNATLIGNGITQTRIMLPNGWNAPFYRTIANTAGASDFEIANISVDGNQENYGGTDRLTRQAHCIFVQQGVRFKVHDNLVHDCLGDAIEIWGNSTPSRHGRVYNNYLHDMIQAGIGLISVADTEVFGNLVDPGAKPVFGGIHGEPSSIGQWIYNLDIHDNVLIGGEGISATSPVGNGLNTSHNAVRNNTMTGGGGIVWMRNPYSEIAGNNIIGCLADNAIGVMSHDIRVLNNVITAQSARYVVTNYSAAIAVDNSSVNSGSGEAAGYGNNVIQSNTIQGWIRAGIRINNSGWNRIMGNNIRNIQQGGTSNAMSAVGAYAQATITGLTHDSQIIGNMIVDTQARPTMLWALYNASDLSPYVALNNISNMAIGTVYGGANLTATPVPADCYTGTGFLPDGSIICGAPVPDIVTQTESYLAVPGDANKFVIMNCGSPCTLTLPSSPPPAWEISVLSIGAFTAAVALNGLTYNGSPAAPAVVDYKTMRISTDGSNYFGSPARAAQ
jgi:hypothetical protein